MKLRSRAIATIIGVALLGLCFARPAAAQPVRDAGAQGNKSTQTRKAPDSLAGLPADVDVVVACRSLSNLRTTPAASFIVDTLAADALDPVREGWDELAKAIGLSPVQAFDAILGERVVLAIRRGGDALPDWTIQAYVDGKTEALLRDRLKVVPRTIVAGQTLYAVERGALELSVLRVEGRSGKARVVLAPSGSPLFAEILRAKPGVTPSVLDTPMGESFRGAPSGDILVLARLRERADAWAALAGTVDDSSLRATVRGALTHSKPGVAEISGWSETEVRTMVGDSFAAVFESGASALTEVGDVLGGMLPGKIRTLFECDELLTGREIVLLLPDSAGRPALLAGVELEQLNEGAKFGDEAMDAMLEMVGAPPRGFGGIAPLAVRRVNESGISLAWAYAPVDPAARDSRSWWIHTTDPEQLDGARSALPGLTPQTDGLRAFVSARPARLIKILTDEGNAFPGVAAALSRIESLEWIEAASPEKVLDGRLTVRFAPQKGSAPLAGSRQIAPR
jgi:hypothetical protein